MKSLSTLFSGKTLNFFPGKTLIFSTTLVLCTTTLTHAPKLLAHGSLEPELGLNVEAELTATYSSETLHDEVWLIPGMLMGGEVYGMEQGARLNEASLHTSYGTLEDTFAALEVGSHYHHDEYETELEEAKLGQYWQLSDSEIRLEAGRMKGLFTQANAQHLSDNHFESRALIYSAFLGGHYADNGLRSMFKYKDWRVGLELWEGDAYPASSNGGINTYDIFAYYELSDKNRWHLNLGVWHMGAKSQNRKDDRFSSGHSHGLTGSALSDITFSGDQKLTGLHAAMSWNLNGRLNVLSTSELIWNHGDGTIRDRTRQADLKFNHLGAWHQFVLAYGKHHVGLRYDWLGLKNKLSGAGAINLAQDANLNEHGDPYRISLAYNYLFKPQVILKVGTTTDETDKESDRSVWVSVSWKASYSP